MSTKQGITGIKALCLLLVNFVAQGIQSFKDGFQPTDLTDFIDEGMQAATSAGVFKNIGPEVKDGISEAEATELITAIKKAFVEKNLGLKNEAQADALAAAILDAGLANAKVYYAAKELAEAVKAG